MVERLPPDMIRKLLDACDPCDAHHLAATCHYIRECVTGADLQRYRCGVVRYQMLCERYHWSRYPDRWNNRKECPYCHAVIQSQSRYDRHVTACKILGLRQIQPCEWCNIRSSGNKHAGVCPLKPDVKCGNTQHGFKTCKYQGLRAKVEHHRKTCTIRCVKCRKRCSMNRAKYHSNIVSDRCDAMIYKCPKCKQLWKGIDYGDHQPCLPDLDFHRPGSQSSVSRYF